MSSLPISNTPCCRRATSRVPLSSCGACRPHRDDPQSAPAPAPHPYTNPAPRYEILIPVRLPHPQHPRTPRPISQLKTSTICSAALAAIAHKSGQLSRVFDVPLTPEEEVVGFGGTGYSTMPEVLCSRGISEGRQDNESYEMR